ncbi:MULTISPECIES: MFS transporter [Kitasatospora]
MLLSCLLVFLAQLTTTIYLPSLPEVARHFGTSGSGAELSVSCFVIGAAAPVVLWGVAADRYGRRAALLAALALFTGAGAALMVTGSLPVLLALRTLQGVGAGGSAIIARILVRDLGSGTELARRLSVLSIAFIGALGGGQFLGGLIDRYARWQTGFGVLAALGLVAMLGTLLLPMEPASATRTPSADVWRNCLAIARTPGFLRPAAAGGLGFAALVLLQQVSPFVLQQHFGLSAEASGTLGLLLGAAYLAGALTVNRLVARVGPERLLRSGPLVVTGAGALLTVLWSLPRLPSGAALAAFTALCCAVAFGQSVLFPNSMATAVGAVADPGAYAMSLCGFLQQSMAGATAAGAVLLHGEVLWSAAVAGLGLAAWLLTHPPRRAR